MLRPILLGIFIIFGLWSCEPNKDVISPADFPKIEQEVLGDQLWYALTSESSPLEILSPASHPELYSHVRSLYKQSYFIIRAKQGWSTNRDWQIGIFKDDNESAFALPGGNMMISTGMLKSFRKEYELFYLMSFENALMDSGYLFSSILTYIEDSIDIEELIKENDEMEAIQIGLEIQDLLEFNSLVVQEIDLATMQWICESSNFRIDGITQFLPRLLDNSKWKRSRDSAINRLNAINNNFLSLDCDNTTRITSLGNNFYVDEFLTWVP